MPNYFLALTESGKRKLMNAVEGFYAESLDGHEAKAEFFDYIEDVLMAIENEPFAWSIDLEEDE